MTKKFILYDCDICPYAQRAHIALKEVGVEFERVEIDLLNKPKWYTNVNPEGKVPCLSIDDYNLPESMVIVQYLVDSFPEKNLLPQSPLKRAEIRFAIEYFNDKIALEYFKFIVNSKGENARANYEENISKALLEFDTLLKKQSPNGPYFLGEEFSMADIAMAPFVRRIRDTNYRMGFYMDVVKQSPRLSEFIQGCITRPSVEETIYKEEEELFKFKQKKFDFQY